jgi:hypothetical protein
MSRGRIVERQKTYKTFCFFRQNYLILFETVPTFYTKPTAVTLISGQMVSPEVLGDGKLERSEGRLAVK